MSDKKLIVSPQYPKGILVDLTQDEITQRVIDAENYLVRQQAEEFKKQEQEARKQSAIAKLNALGLTQEEILSILK
jgi:hypothetical protein